MNKLVLATGNQKKVKELAAMLADMKIQVIPQSEFAVSDADETGTTFVENAIIKARHAARVTGLPAVADDSGLEVDLLHGRPGVYSARFAGAGASDKENIDKLLAELKGAPDYLKAPASGACWSTCATPTIPPPSSARPAGRDDHRRTARPARLRLRPRVLRPRPRLHLGPDAGGAQEPAQPPWPGLAKLKAALAAVN
jgi:hypothetical protein